MTNPIDQTQRAIDNLIAFIEQSPWSGEYLDKLKLLKMEVEQPCVLAVAGRVKAGKSSFINAILGKDLAKVGTTECTATINVFKYGMPPSPEKPVCCIWKNGQKTWETPQFLDGLQGSDKATLQRAEGISHFEYYLPDPILKDVTLVDTPGTDALVGENDDSHQKVTEVFFKLRQRHAEETLRETQQADAVIYLVAEVANVSNQEFLQEFHGATGGNSSAMNAIGVMARIDVSDSIIEQRHNLAAGIASKMQHELNTVVPVSAGIWRALDKLKKENRFEHFQDQIRSIPALIFEKLLSSEDTYLRESSRLAKVFNLNNEKEMPDVEIRKAMRSDMPWRVFVVISRHMYQYPLDQAVKKLYEISGVDAIKLLLETHFFKRGNLLRCFRIVNDLNTILRDIERNKLYELRKEAGLKTQFDGFIRTHPTYREDNRLGDKLLAFLNRYLKNEGEIEKIESKIHTELIQVVEDLYLRLKESDEKFNALQLIENSPDMFTDSERTELYALFGMYSSNEELSDESIRAQKQQFWNLECRLSRSEVRRKVAYVAVSCYGKV
jgi:GTPase Era involved in 16S rRNA processing